MKRNFLSKVIRTIVMTIALCYALPSFAQHNPWELIYEHTATNAFYITENGNMLLADLLFDYTGGIFISTDNGGSWEKCDIEDNNYNIFIEHNGYVFAAGSGSYIARSANDGVTWEMISYASAVEDALGDNIPYTL